MTRKAKNEFPDLHAFVLIHLERWKGAWREVEAKTGVPYFTLSKIASGRTPDPRVSTVQKLANFFASNPESHSPTSKAA